jgi:methylmalonyl-CoA/ethylmalonyl-CoA epimerase
LYRIELDEVSMPTIKRIHHIAVVVNSLEKSLPFWQEMLGIHPSRVIDVPQEAARVAFLPLGESEIELVQPVGDGSGLDRYLEKHGPGMHHLCLEVDDLAGMLEKLRERGVMLINDQPKVSDDGRLYAFIHPRSAQGVLIELYQLPDAG